MYSALKVLCTSLLVVAVTACSSKQQSFYNLPPQMQALHKYLNFINEAAYFKDDQEAVFTMLRCDVPPGQGINIYHLAGLRKRDKDVFLECWDALKAYPLTNKDLQFTSFNSKYTYKVKAGKQYHLIKELNKCLDYFDTIYELDDEEIY